MCPSSEYEEHYRRGKGNNRDIMDLGRGMFCSTDRTIINWLGDNYYKACGAEVTSFGEEGTLIGRVKTTCVKPLRHPAPQHEDFDGRVTPAYAGVICPLCFKEFDKHFVSTEHVTVDGRKGVRSVGWTCPTKTEVKNGG